MDFQIVTRTGHPGMLDLPWDVPLSRWEVERLVEVERGVGRHVVRFVKYGATIYSLKELPDAVARHEYRSLLVLGESSVPAVEAVGVVTRADGNSILITRYLDFSLPYRTLFARSTEPVPIDRLLDALAELLVRLHLVGCYWGDCSLSNSLFRKDAGRFTAYLVDAETAELHAQLSDGQRDHDLALAREHVAGELMDLDAAGERLSEDVDPMETPDNLARRYEALWSELTREEVFAAHERYRVDARLRRLNELGFDVYEVELVACDGGHELKFQPRVVEPGHHRRRLRTLTALDVQENQARRLLNDMAGFGAYLEQKDGSALPEPVVARRWLTEVYEPTIARIEDDLPEGLEAAEAFHEILEHRWYLSQEAGRDVGLETAADSYVNQVLPPKRVSSQPVTDSFESKP